MVKLTMASFLPHLLPTIQLNQSDKIFDFHAGSLAQSLFDTQLGTSRARSEKESQLLSGTGYVPRP